MRTTVLVVLCFLIVFAGAFWWLNRFGMDRSDPRRAIIAAVGEGVDVMKGITDESSAKQANDRFRSLAKRIMVALETAKAPAESQKIQLALLHKQFFDEFDRINKLGIPLILVSPQFFNYLTAVTMVMGPILRESNEPGGKLPVPKDAAQP
jgi:hypothetical protein